MHTGENEQGLRRIIDLTRLMSIIILLLHFYYCCYQAFTHWQLTTDLSSRLLAVIARTGLFERFHTSKYIAFGLLVISLLGAKGKKDEKLRYSTAVACILSGLFLYFASAFFLISVGFMWQQAVLYVGLASLGYVLILRGGTLLSRIISLKLSHDVFNKLNETFPSEERLLENEYSINLASRYNLKNSHVRLSIDYYTLTVKVFSGMLKISYIRLTTAFIRLYTSGDYFTFSSFI